jgi:DNA-directed RNA polymerase specialized sigma24 family protein
MTPAMSPDADQLSKVQPVIPALRRYARARLHYRDDADDLVQDVLERALARWHQRRGRQRACLAVHHPAQPGDGSAASPYAARLG